MVGASEESRLNCLEIQVDNGGGGAWEYLCLVRKLKARRSDKVLKHGLSILNDHRARSKLGGEEWTLYEQVAIAAMDCQRVDIAKDCIAELRKQFPGSMRVGRLEGMLLEVKGAWPEAEKAYQRLLEDNPLDQLEQHGAPTTAIRTQLDGSSFIDAKKIIPKLISYKQLVIHKRKVAMAKAQGNASVVVEYLRKYLEIFMADHDAWRELAEIYVSLQMYKQAAFCYEELILCQPLVPPYHLAYAEVLYTMGGLENLQTAKMYYASTINLTGGKNTRALYGVCLCIAAINQLSKGRNKEEESSELQTLAAESLVKDYKLRAPVKLPLLTAALRNVKLVS